MSAIEIQFEKASDLTPEERLLVLEGWNQTAAEYPGMRVHQLVTMQAERTPQKTAVVFEGQKLSYAQLEARSNQLAHVLQQQGVGTDSLVALCVERSLEMLIALLAIGKAGGAYVPLDPAYPAERIAGVLEDCGARLLLTSSTLLSHLGQFAGTTLCLDRDAMKIAAQPGTPVVSDAGPEHLAYVIYTSGSTGKPKGVAIEHRAVVNLLCSVRREPGLTADDVLVAVTTLSFDIAGLELYAPLLCGGTVVLASRNTASDGIALARLLESSQATVMQATPATWRMLLEAGWQGRKQLRALCGGEALPRELAHQLLPCVASLWNLYGPTETTIWSAVEEVQEDSGPVLLGRPMANTRFYVLDEQRQPLPVGVPGELCIGGDGLARGYWQRPELTAEKFLADPFRAGQRIYRTGDLVRWKADGRLEFLGRIDHQVKVRGFRIELGEIESVLETNPAIAQAVVTARQDTPGDTRLVAYYRSRDGQALDAAALRQHLSQQLPDYMLPAAFVRLDQFPLTPNGKVDRKTLPAPSADDLGLVSNFVAPRTPIEEALAADWARILKLEQVGVLDNFFDLGGHSLLATQVLASIRREFGIELPFQVLFQQPTIAHMADAVTRELLQDEVGAEELLLAEMEDNSA